MPEVIFGQGKTPQEVVTIAQALLNRSQNVLITRAEKDAVTLVQEHIPEAEYFPRSRAIRVQRDNTMYGKGVIAIACAGTSDEREAVGRPVGADQRVHLQRQADQQRCQEEKDGADVGQCVQRHEARAHRSR